MTSLIPVWILGAPFVGLLILSFSFKRPTAMAGDLPRTLTRDRMATDTSATPLQPMYSDAVHRGPREDGYASNTLAASGPKLIETSARRSI
jgi:hypothetical protein